MDLYGENDVNGLLVRSPRLNTLPSDDHTSSPSGGKYSHFTVVQGSCMMSEFIRPMKTRNVRLGKLLPKGEISTFFPPVDGGLYEVQDWPAWELQKSKVGTIGGQETIL